MIKYRTNNWWGEIEAVEVERETASSVWVDGRREKKETESATYHDTWDEAHHHLTVLAENKVRICRDNLERAKSRAGNIKGMKPPASQ